MKWVVRIIGGLAAIILLAVVVLFALGRRSEAGHIHAAIEIAASRDQVWQWVNDPDKLKQWISWLVEVRSDPAHPSGVGARRVLVMRDENNGGQLMEIEGTCREYSPPQRLTIDMSSAGAFDGNQTYLLTELANGRTHIEVDSHYHFGIWFARLMEPIITHFAEQKMQMDIARLKELAEKQKTI